MYLVSCLFKCHILKIFWGWNSKAHLIYKPDMGFKGLTIKQMYLVFSLY